MSPLPQLTLQTDDSLKRPPQSLRAFAIIAAAVLLTATLSSCVYDWPASRIPQDGQPLGCGNGTIEPPEDCDSEDLVGSTCVSLGYGGGTLGCATNCAFDTSSCESNAVCGDSVVAPNEGCDDGNLADDDGCDSGCDVEGGWACRGDPSVCAAGCGNGVCHLDGAEDHVSCPDDCGWIQLSAGDTHTCGVKADGTAWCWGSNTAGQLGDSTTEPRAAPVRVGTLTGLIAIAAGGSHSCAIDDQGHGWCWGDNNVGQLGNNSLVPSVNPVPVAGLAEGETLAAGTQHTCATTTAHEAYCWGDNSDGQLGNGSTINMQAAELVAMGEGLTSAHAITVGERFSCALREDNTVWCWGYNNEGQLGAGTTENSLVPVAVDTSGGYPGGSVLSAGTRHICSRDTTGVAWCWGEGAERRLGSGFTGDAQSPSLVNDIDSVSDVAAGGSHSCGLAVSGAGWCWGSGSEGQLGTGTTPPNTEPQPVLDATTMLHITAGLSHSCAIMVDWTAWCWGANDAGQLGDGSSLSRDAPVPVSDPY